MPVTSEQEYYTWKDDPYSSHSIVLNWLKKFQPYTKILDVGCAHGTLGKYLAHHNYHLVGVEPNPRWAKLADKYYDNIINAPLADVNPQIFAQQDVVLLLDVLEHLADPYSQLKRISESLPPSSCIIISIPNVAHLYIRLMLLLGRFDYTQKGILDKTHLRFFTQKTFRNMLNDNCLNIEQFTVTPVPLPVLHQLFVATSIGRIIHYLNAKVAHFFPSLLGYQFVVLVRPHA